MMIAEESTAWPKVTHAIEHGGLGFTHKWNLGWMHDTLRYFSTDPVHRRWHHRELSFGLLYAFSERFVLPMSHDEVVHGKASLLGKMPGDDWQKFANLRAMFTWMWAMPGAPLVFMGAELAPWTEWNDAGGLPWHLLDHRAAPRRPRPDGRAQSGGRHSGERCGSAITNRPVSSGSTPTTRCIRRTRSCVGATPARMRSLASPTSRPCRAPATESGCRGRGVAGADRLATADSSPAPDTAASVANVSATTEVHMAGSAGVGRVRSAAAGSRAARRGSPVIEALARPAHALGHHRQCHARSGGRRVRSLVRSRRRQRRRHGRPGLCDVAVGLHRRDPVLGGQRHRRRRIAGVGVRGRAAAGGAQRRLRPGDVASPHRFARASDSSLPS